MDNLKYHEIISANRILADKQQGKVYKVAILANIAIHQLSGLLEYSLRILDVNADVQMGGFDNIVQDSAECGDCDLVIVFWDFAHIADGLKSDVNLMSDDQVTDLRKQLQCEFDFLFSNLRTTPLVFFNALSVLPYTNQNLIPDRSEILCKLLNCYIEERVSTNIMIVDIDKVMASISIDRSIDVRYLYRAKSPYSIAFYKKYVEHIKPAILAVLGKSKKALIFDCDNTLWRGVLGEDGVDKIEMSSETPFGTVFAEVQNLALDLNRRGVLLGLCSKNNAAEVDEVIRSHPDMKLSIDHLAVRKVNWEDKASNLIAISAELNIGLDSIVFIDDSPFETNLVKEALPDVTVLRVPENLFLYPQMLRDNFGLFFSLALSDEDVLRGEMYKSQAKRDVERRKYENLEDYLSTLELAIQIGLNDSSHVTRLAQLTQKTNQFNLTTKRYTEVEIDHFIQSEDHWVYDLSAWDKMGGYGLTGLCILALDLAAKKVEIDTFLLSCRILGRNIEWAFAGYIISAAIAGGFKWISSEYLETQKNEQVKNFYDDLGFTQIETAAGKVSYRLELTDYAVNKTEYITINGI